MKQIAKLTNNRPVIDPLTFVSNNERLLITACVTGIALNAAAELSRDSICRLTRR